MERNYLHCSSSWLSAFKLNLFYISSLFPLERALYLANTIKNLYLSPGTVRCLISLCAYVGDGVSNAWLWMCDLDEDGTVGSSELLPLHSSRVTGFILNSGHWSVLSFCACSCLCGFSLGYAILPLGVNKHVHGLPYHSKFQGSSTKSE